MRFVIIVSLLLTGNAYGKKKLAAIPQRAAETTKSIVIEKADIFEGRLLNIDSAKIMEAQKAQEARVLDYRNRLEKHYGIQFAKGDAVDLSSGLIQWHKEPDLKPPGGAQ